MEHWNGNRERESRAFPVLAPRIHAARVPRNRVSGPTAFVFRLPAKIPCLHWPYPTRRSWRLRGGAAAPEFEDVPARSPPGRFAHPGRRRTGLPPPARTARTGIFRKRGDATPQQRPARRTEDKRPHGTVRRATRGGATVERRN